MATFLGWFGACPNQGGPSKYALWLGLLEFWWSDWFWMALALRAVQAFPHPVRLSCQDRCSGRSAGGVRLVGEEGYCVCPPEHMDNRPAISCEQERCCATLGSCSMDFSDLLSGPRRNGGGAAGCWLPCPSRPFVSGSPDTWFIWDGLGRTFDFFFKPKETSQGLGTPVGGKTPWRGWLYHWVSPVWLPDGLEMS